MRGITLFSLFNLALKNIVLLIISALVFGSATYAYCEYIATPRYKATASILITNGKIIEDTDIDEDGESKKIENTDIVASLNFMSTAIDMLKQDQIYKTLANETDNKYSYSKLRGMSDISRRTDNSLYIDISFSCSSKDEAVKLVNKYLELCPSYIKSQVSSASVSYQLTDVASKVYPQTVMTTLMAAIMGIAIVFAILVLIFLMNTTITGEEEFKERFDIPVIGVIPDFSSARSHKSYKYYNKYYNKYYGYDGNYGKGGNKNGK